MNLMITGKTTTSNEKAVSGNILLCYMSMWKTTLLSANRDDNETRPQRKITTIGGKLKRPVVKLAPKFYESVFLEKNSAGKVGASH